MFGVMLETARYLVLPVTFPLLFGVHANHTADTNTKKGKIVHVISAPFNLAGRYLLPSEEYLSMGE